MTYLAKTIGAARGGDVVAARQDLAKYEDAVASGGADAQYSVASSASVGEKEAEAWVAFADGKNQEALATMRDAVLTEHQQISDSDSLSTPAREMLGDMLLEMKRPGEALVEYKAALVESPNRFDGLYGAAQAAQLAGNATEARGYLAKLVKICSPDADRPELQEAREEVAKQ
jgi:tetratricopeptide (TPR) repeat protein